MADGIYIGMTGAAARAEQLDSIADNLANAQTPGFKAARPAFQAFLPADNERGDKQYAASVSTAIDLRPGMKVATGDPLDVMPDGNAFLAVEFSGGVAYTRNGKLSVDAEGFLRAANQRVLSASGAPIQLPPHTAPSIGKNGEVTAGGAEIARLGFYELNGPVDRIGSSLLIASTATQATPIDGTVSVGAMELSNAQPLEATVQLVTVQRHFDSAMQAIQTYRRLDERANEIGRLK